MALAQSILVSQDPVDAAHRLADYSRLTATPAR